jgi:hypothetical protein
MSPKLPKPMNSSPSPADIVRLRRKSETQDGGRRTGNTSISCSIVDRSEIRNAISVFDIGQTDKVESDTRQHRPTPEMQDGGLRLGFRHLALPVSAGVRLEFIGVVDIESIDIIFRFSFLSMLEREIQLPV